MKLKRKAVSYSLAIIGQPCGRWLPSAFKKLDYMESQIEYKNNNQGNYLNMMATIGHRVADGCHQSLTGTINITVNNKRFLFQKRNNKTILLFT